MEKRQTEHKGPPDLRYKDIINFYIPLLLNSGILTLSAPFLNYGLSTAIKPEIALAAFSAGFSVGVCV